MAGATGLEPATSGVTGRRSNQLSYAPAAVDRQRALLPFPSQGVKHTRRRGGRFFAMVGDDGLEPPTLSV